MNVMMRDWFLQNWGDILVLGVIALVLGAIVFFYVRARHRGKSTCAHGCAGCAMQGLCHGQGKQKSDN